MRHGFTLALASVCVMCCVSSAQTWNIVVPMCLDPGSTVDVLLEANSTGTDQASAEFHFPQ